MYEVEEEKSKGLVLLLSGFSQLYFDAKLVHKAVTVKLDCYEVDAEVLPLKREVKVVIILYRIVLNDIVYKCTLKNITLFCVFVKWCSF